MCRVTPPHGDGISSFGGQRICNPVFETGERALHHELRHRRRHGEPGGDGGEDEVNKSSFRTSAYIGRPVGASRRRQGGEPEAQVREPGPRAVHREPHVSLERLPDHRHQEQTEVRYPRTGAEEVEVPGRQLGEENLTVETWRGGVVFSADPGIVQTPSPEFKLTI